jgi:hypothetical protein
MPMNLLQDGGIHVKITSVHFAVTIGKVSDHVREVIQAE